MVELSPAARWLLERIRLIESHGGSAVFVVRWGDHAVPTAQRGTCYFCGSDVAVMADSLAVARTFGAPTLVCVDCTNPPPADSLRR